MDKYIGVEAFNQSLQDLNPDEWFYTPKDIHEVGYGSNVIYGSGNIDGLMIPEGYQVLHIKNILAFSPVSTADKADETKDKNDMLIYYVQMNMSFFLEGKHFHDFDDVYGSSWTRFLFKLRKKLGKKPYYSA